jgi:hypothetical protein
MLALSCGLALGCSSSPGSDTEMVVMVWSDLAVPTELDNVRVEITGQTATRSLSYPLTAGTENGKTKLPLQISLVPGNDQQLAFDVKVTGLLNGNIVVSQEASSSCILRQRRVLTLFLGRSCVNTSCGSGLTCVGGNCASIVVSPSTLPVYDPNHLPSPSDASVPALVDAGSGAEGGGGRADDGGLDVGTTPPQGGDGSADNLPTAVDADHDLLVDMPNRPDVPQDTPTISDDGGRDLASPDFLADAARPDVSEPEAKAPDAAVDSPGSTCSYACCSNDDCSAACQVCGASHTCVPVINQDDPTGRCIGTCDSTGACKSKRGQTCSTVAAGCTTGTTCADGYCCDRTCNDSCEACDVPGSLGTCTTLKQGASPHQGHPACTNTVAACAGTCSGSSASCFYNTGPCGTASCTGATYQPAGTCSAGACVPSQAQACPNGQSCSDNACACVSPMTTCSGSCVNFQNDANNCGGCGQACSTNNGASSCTTGSCWMSSCASGYLDCSANENVSRNGCETNSAVDVNNCGQCGKVCPNDWSNATPKCGAVGCGHQCVAPWDDCDGGSTNGCEANLNTDGQHCGHCNNPCSSTVCRNQVCLTTARYGNTGAGSSNVNIGQDTMAGIQVYVPNASVVTALGVVLYGSTATRNMYLGLYKDVAGSPGDLVAAAGPSLVAPGGKELGITSAQVDIAAGNYWILGVWDGTAAFASNSTAPVTWRYVSHAFGALPTTAPTGMGTTSAAAPNLYVVVAQ